MGDPLPNAVAQKVPLNFPLQLPPGTGTPGWLPTPAHAVRVSELPSESHVGDLSTPHCVGGVTMVWLMDLFKNLVTLKPPPREAHMYKQHLAITF